MLSESQFAFLRSIDTPTVCNLIEIVAPERRGAGYTVSHLHCPFPDLPPMVGFAKTVTMRARDKVGGASYMAKRMDYLDYVAAEPLPGHRGDRGFGRPRRLRRVLGRSADQCAQGARLPRHHHQRLGARHSAGRRGFSDARRIDFALARLCPRRRFRHSGHHPRHGGKQRRPHPRRPPRRRGGAGRNHRSPCSRRSTG